MSAIEGRNLNRRGAAWLITAAGLVFLLNAILNYFLFQPGEGMYRGSIEPGYIGTARFIAAHPHLWGWNPLQYCGLPTQFTYVPALPYLSALLTWVTGWPTELSYRLITATAVCLAPVSVFLLVRFFTGARWWALGAAVACTMFSPAYGLVRQIMLDRGVLQLPWRIHIIAKYGESPHSTGLALMPLAVIALWAAATSRSYRKLVLASGLLAAVTLTNWVAGLALGIVCSLMLLAAWRAPDAKEFRTRRALAAAGLAYLLACFWLTPSFIRTIAFNWPVDAFNYQLSIRKWLLLALLLGGIVGLRCLLLAFRRGFYTTWVTLCAFVLGWLIMWFYSKGVEIIPEARRYTLEFELFLMLALIEWLRLAWRSGDQVKRACAVASAGVLLASGLPQAYRYATQVWTRWQPPARETTIEHRVATWLNRQKPGGRVLVSGSLRFRLNSWYDLPQVGGVFESGLRNRMPIHLTYQIFTGEGSRPESEGADAVRQMIAMGVEYAVVHGPKSAEHYHDYSNPRKFEGVIERVFHTADDSVYRVPFRSLAHLVRENEYPEYPHQARMHAFAAALIDPVRPRLAASFHGTSEIEIRGAVPPGTFVSVLVSYDPGWRAEQDGKPVSIAPDPLGFMKLAPATSPDTRIVLRFGPTAEQIVFAAISALAWLGAVGLLLRRA